MIQQTTTAILPALQLRDGPRIALIQAANSAATVLDTLPLATGIAETFWDRQMRRFGDEALPMMAQRLRTAAAIQDQTIRGLVYENSSPTCAGAARGVPLCCWWERRTKE